MRNLNLRTVAAFLCLALLALGGCRLGGDRDDDVPSITGPASPLSNATVGTAFSATFTARGGGSITWSSTGTLPPGMSLNSTSGLYSGTPTTAGAYTFTVQASNSRGMDADPYMQTVAAAGGGNPGPNPNANVNASALLTGNNLSAFALNMPSGLETPIAVTGLTAGDTLVSIDRRPQNGYLYGLGYNGTAGTVQLYSVSAATGVATAVGTSGSFVAADGTTAVRVGVDNATIFGIDFNPTVDRVRAVNSAGQNFRINPNNGAFVDGNTGVAGTQTDGGINGLTMAVQETAYTNNSQNATVTTQYTLDLTLDALCIQNPPNAGTQTACQTLSSPVESVLGFDIPAGVDVATANMPATGSGTAVVKIAGQTAETLVQVNLTSGALTTSGTIGTGGIIGLALQQPTATPLVALSADATQLLRFSSATPGTVVTVAITGVTAGETLVGIDYRPQTGQLFGFGVADAANTGTLYVLDPQTGAATAVGAASQVAFVDASAAAVDLPPVTAGYGFDFNPTVDRVRVVTGTGLNFRLNPTNGAPVDGNLNNTATPPAGINTDAPINTLPAGSTGVTAAAYTNSFGQSLMGGVTTQYVIDSDSNMLFIQNPPNAGTLTAGQTITVGGSTLDFTAANGFDIPPQVRTATSGTAVTTGTAFAALTVGGASRLYSINLVNGQATDLGAIGANVSGLAAGQITVR